MNVGPCFLKVNKNILIIINIFTCNLYCVEITGKDFHLNISKKKFPTYYICPFSFFSVLTFILYKNCLFVPHLKISSLGMSLFCIASYLYHQRTPFFFKKRSINFIAKKYLQITFLVALSICFTFLPPSAFIVYSHIELLTFLQDSTTELLSPQTAN